LNKRFRARSPRFGASELEAERKLVKANRELIARMEAKTKAKLAEVWGEEEERGKEAQEAIVS